MVEGVVQVREAGVLRRYRQSLPSLLVAVGVGVHVVPFMLYKQSYNSIGVGLEGARELSNISTTRVKPSLFVIAENRGAPVTDGDRSKVVMWERWFNVYTPPPHSCGRNCWNAWNVARTPVLCQAW